MAVQSTLAEQHYMEKSLGRRDNECCYSMVERAKMAQFYGWSHTVGGNNVGRASF